MIVLHPRKKTHSIQIETQLRDTKNHPREGNAIEKIGTPPPIQGMSMKTLHAPSRHCRYARVYRHTTTAMHGMSTPPIPGVRPHPGDPHPFRGSNSSSRGGHVNTLPAR